MEAPLKEFILTAADGSKSSYGIYYDLLCGKTKWGNQRVVIASTWASLKDYAKWLAGEGIIKGSLSLTPRKTVQAQP